MAGANSCDLREQNVRRSSFLRRSGWRHRLASCHTKMRRRRIHRHGYATASGAVELAGIVALEAAVKHCVPTAGSCVDFERWPRNASGGSSVRETNVRRERLTVRRSLRGNAPVGIVAESRSLDLYQAGIPHEAAPEAHHGRARRYER